MAQLTYPAYGAEPGELPEVAGAPQAIEFRHLRYLVAVADAGTFTHAAERMFIAQPTLSQQIRRLRGNDGHPLAAPSARRRCSSPPPAACWWRNHGPYCPCWNTG